MPQTWLPLFPDGATAINELVCFEKTDGWIYYFHAGLPVFSHPENDRESLKVIVSQLVVTGSCKQAEIVRALGISSISMKRSVKVYREKGIAGFFPKQPERKPRVLTQEVLAEVQRRLNDGQQISEIAQELKMKDNTIRKAISAGRLVVTGGKKRRLRGFDQERA